MASATLRLSEPATGVFSAMPVQNIHMHEKKIGQQKNSRKKDIKRKVNILMDLGFSTQDMAATSSGLGVLGLELRVSGMLLKGLYS
jgi:hypothetical protein